MWRLLKAELSYYKRIFLYIFIISIVGFINLHNATIIVKNYPSKESMGYVFLAHMLIYFMGGLFAFSIMKEKKILDNAEMIELKKFKRTMFKELRSEMKEMR